MNPVSLTRTALAVTVLALAGVVVAQDPKPAQPAQPALRLAAPAAPQQKSQEELKKLLDEELALPVFKNAPWTFDYDKARAEAKNSGKLIFGYFSRSYAY